MLLVALVNCDAEPTDTLPTPKTMPPPMMPPAPVDETAPFFDSSRIMQVEITIANDDWDELRSQTRDFVDILQGSDCMDQPFEKIFTYFPGEVKIDGTVVENIGVRKKGFLGSLSDTRPSLKLKFNEYVLEQTFSGFERMTLNNVRQDPAAIGQCLAYSLYTKAGALAPRCSFAHVTVNGEDLGIYAHVDSIKKRFLSLHFDDNDGHLWEGTISDFRENWTKTFEQKTDREMSASRAKIEALTSALTVSDDELLAAIEPHVDLENFLTYWAMESLVWHWDGYAGNRNNYYFYENPGDDKISFIAWGVDAAFTGRHPFRDRMGPLSVLGQGYLSYRLYNHPEGRLMYLNKLQSVLDQVWNENEILSQIAQMEILIRNTVIREGFGPGLDGIRNFVRNRRAILQTDIDRGGIDWKPELPQTICREPRGRAQGNFTTKWGTHPAPNTFDTGSGTMTVDFEEFNLPNMMAGAAAGMGDDENAGKAVFVSVGYGPNGSGFPILFVTAPPERIKTGEVLDMESASIEGHYLYKPAQAELIYVGQLTKGSVTLTQAGTDDGNDIIATYDVEIF
jgi:hypothetical protein